MTFHRFSVPVYTGGLPGGYDYINNATSGTPASYAGPRADGGPNNGTYFVGFGEDGRGAFVNRGLKALAENTDYLDDLLRRDVAIPAITANATAASPVSSIVLSGPGVFLGAAGTPNTTAGINTFFELLDDLDREIIDANGDRCQITALAGGSVGSGGFSAGNVTLTVSPAIPAGVTYRVYYGVRGNLATLPVDALTNVKIRSAQEISADLLGPGGASLIGAPAVNGPLAAFSVAEGSVGSQLSSIVIETDVLADAVSLLQAQILDKRAGQTDSLSSLITLSGAGRLVQAAATAPDANATFQIDQGNLWVFIPQGLTAGRTYTLSNTNAVAGDQITFFFDPGLPNVYNAVIKSEAGVTLATIGPESNSYWGRFYFTGTEWTLQASASNTRLWTQEFTSSGTWFRQVGVSMALAIGVGGGGGGGGGAGGIAASGPAGGGSGGGGARLGIGLGLALSSSSYAVTTGTGGTAGNLGTAGVAGGNGGDGGDSSVFGYVFKGAQGGTGGRLPSNPGWSVGGRQVRNPVGSLGRFSSTLTDPQPGQGGVGWADTSTQGSQDRYMAGGNTSLGTGGTGGISGSGSPAGRGGGGGGGGASDYPGSTGGVGGDGGDNVIGNGVAGTAGTLGAGGGGGGGAYNGGGAAGGAGGAGAPGAIRIIWFR